MAQVNSTQGHCQNLRQYWILQQNKFMVGGQESGFKIPRLPQPGPLYESILWK